MGFDDMKRGPIPPDDATHFAPVSEDDHDQAMHQRVLDQAMALHATLHPHWKPTMFFNQDFSQSEDVVKIADTQGDDTYPYWLAVEALEYHPFFKFPEAERLFRERGYVHENDVTAFAIGQHSPHITFLDVNLSALRTQFYVFKVLLSDILRADGPYRFQGTKSWYYANFMGGVSGSDPDKEPVLLAERGGILLPWLDQALAYPFHLAYAATDDTVRIQPIDFDRHFGSQNADIKSQLKREVANSALYFAGATPVALTLWHSQILAYLRKIAARIEVECGPLFNVVGRRAEAKNADVIASTRKLLAAKLPFGNVELVSTFQVVTDDIVDQVSDQALEWKAAGRQFNNADPSVQWTVSENQRLVACLHGATYFDLDHDRFDPMGDAYTIAAWVGELKRTRQAKFTLGMAHCFENFRESLHREIALDIETTLFHSLGENVWEVLFEISADARQASDEEIDYVVNYQWIGDDAATLWQVNRDNQVLTITGPLLDFPIADVQFWNAEADRLVQERRFGI